MSELQRPGYGKYNAPPMLKFLLLLAVVFGFYLRNCSMKSKDKYIKFSNITYQKIDLSSLYVSFEMMNNSNRTGLEKVWIGVYGKDDVLIASKLTNVELQKFKKIKFVRSVEKFSRPIQKNETLDIKIEVFKPSILK